MPSASANHHQYNLSYDFQASRVEKILHSLGTAVGCLDWNNGVELVLGLLLEVWLGHRWNHHLVHLHMPPGHTPLDSELVAAASVIAQRTNDQMFDAGKLIGPSNNKNRKNIRITKSIIGELYWRSSSSSLLSIHYLAINHSPEKTSFPDKTAFWDENSKFQIKHLTVYGVLYLKSLYSRLKKIVFYFVSIIHHLVIPPGITSFPIQMSTFQRWNRSIPQTKSFAF